MDPKELLDIHPLLDDKVRLAIMATLLSHQEAVDFNSLLNKLDLTKGNLSSHIRKLETDGLIAVHKEFVDRKPRTSYTATNNGKAAFAKYLERIELLLSLASK